MQQETAAKPDKVNPLLVPEAVGRQLSLLEVAGIINEQAPQIAISIYAHYEKKFKKEERKHQQAVKLEEDSNQVIVRQDWDYSTGSHEERLQILVFLGPQTSNHNVMIYYPRVRFIFKKIGEKSWKYERAQVGVIENELPIDELLDANAQESRSRTEIIQTEIEAHDFEKVLAPYRNS